MKDFHYTLEYGKQEISFRKIGIFVIEKPTEQNVIAKGLFQRNTFKEQGYVLSQSTVEAIRENEQSYDNYDGIIIFRSDEALNQNKLSFLL